MGAGAGATRYDLYLGSTPMACDLYKKGYEGLNTARTVPTDGRSISLTLWSLTNGAWLQNSYGFIARARHADEVGWPDPCFRSDRSARYFAGESLRARAKTLSVIGGLSLKLFWLHIR